MSEEVAVIIRATPELAEAYCKIFPQAIVRRIKQKEPPKEENTEIKPESVEDREHLLRNIMIFCRERKSPVDGARFFKYYDGRGWVDAAGNKITDWKAKLIEWESNGMNNAAKKFVTAYEYEQQKKIMTDEEKAKLQQDLKEVEKMAKGDFS